MQSIALRLLIYYPNYPALGDRLRPADLLLTLSMRYGWFFICVLMQLSAGGKLVLLPRTGKASDLGSGPIKEIHNVGVIWFTSAVRGDRDE
jgi:hypothetical protein